MTILVSYQSSQDPRVIGHPRDPAAVRNLQDGTARRCGAAWPRRADYVLAGGQQWARLATTHSHEGTFGCAGDSLSHSISGSGKVKSTEVGSKWMTFNYITCLYYVVGNSCTYTICFINVYNDIIGSKVNKRKVSKVKKKYNEFSLKAANFELLLCHQF